MGASSGAFALPAGHYELTERSYTNGCLVLRFIQR